MIADGLTKALNKTPFRRFVEIVGLDNQEERLDLIRRRNDLKERIQETRSEGISLVVTFTHARDLGIRPVTTG